MSQQNQASFLLQAIGENYIMKTYAKGEWKKKLPVVILSVALGMTMIPATCMAAEFNSGDTIKEQTVEDLELSSGENNTKDSQKSEIQWTGFKWDSYSQAEITLTSAVNGVCYYKWAERGEDGNPQVPQIETGNTVNDEVLISEDEEFGITLADLDTDQAVDLYIQIEDENGKLSDLKRMELDQDSRPAKKQILRKNIKHPNQRQRTVRYRGWILLWNSTRIHFMILRLSVPVPIMRIRKTETLSGCLFTGAHLRIRIPTGSEAPGRSVPRKESTRRELLICMFSSANIPARIPNGSLRIRYSLYSTSFSQPHFLKNNTVWSANISLT